MKLPSFALSPPWPRFIAAGGIFLAWFVTSWLQPAVASPAEFVKIVGYTLVGLVFYHAGDKNPAPNSPAARLVGGAVLLAMWVALVAKGSVPASNLIDAMVLILFGLGVLPSPDPAALQMPGSSPQAGFARWRMLAFLSALALAGCAGFAALSPLQQASDACQSYYAAQQTVEAAKSAGKLTPAQLDRYKAADAVVVKACNAKPPTTAASAAELASKVGAETAVLTAINKGK